MTAPPPTSFSNKVSLTAYYCAGARMLDAERPDSLLNDIYAVRFMNDEGRAVFDGFRDQVIPIACNQARAYLIDQTVRQQLAIHPHMLIVLIGAGFDSRAFRMPGGRWVEVDEPGIIARKEAVVPAATCPNSLRRVPIVFAEQSLADVLVPFATASPVLVIVEGVMMYITAAELATTARALQGAFPRHTLTGDVLSPLFIATYAASSQARLAKLGARFKATAHHPLRELLRLGYRRQAAVSVVQTAARLGRMPRLPSSLAWMLWLSPILRTGNEVVTLTFG